MNHVHKESISMGELEEDSREVGDVRGHSIVASLREGRSGEGYVVGNA